MTTHSFQSARPLIRAAMRANAFFCGISGLLLTAFYGPVAAFLGLPEPLIILGTGLMLILYAPFIFKVSQQHPVPKLLAIVIITLDVIWVLGSSVLIFADITPITTGGKWAVAIVADIVVLFAVFQYIGLRRVRQS